MLFKADSSKCTAPKLPAGVPRERLYRRLQSNPNQHLVLVIGQAAQGKSTLVADYLSTQPGPAAWLNLDVGDGDSDGFHHLLMCALDQSRPGKKPDGLGEEIHSALSTSGDLSQYEAMLHSLWRQLPRDITIVLDGLEQIPAGAAAHELIHTMISLAEDKGRIIILSRLSPPLKLQHWLMRRQVLIMDNAELAFSPQEIQTYFNYVHGFTLSADGADHLSKLTEGWAGGLVLLSQALNRRPSSQWDRFLADHLTKKLPDDIRRFFAEEIFDGQSDQIRNFLMKAALVDTIDADILSPLFDDLDPASVLSDLTQRHLFIRKVHDTRQRTAYRMNHMFRLFLRRKFQERFDQPLQRAVYEQIAEFYRNRRQSELAITYFLKAGNLDAAVQSIKKVGTDFIIRGRFTDLEAALSTLPQERIHDDPWLLFLLTLTRRVKGGLRNIEDFHSALTAFENNGDTRGHMLAMAFLIEAQVFAGHDPGSCRQWIRHAEGLLTEHRDTPYFAFARALLWLQIGFGYIASGLDLSKGVSACQNAYLLAHKIESPRLMANSNIVSVMGLVLRGDFIRADESMDKIAAITDTDDYTEYHTLRRLVNVQLALHRGDLESAGRQLAPLADEIETFGLLFLYPAFVDTSGFVQIYNGDFGAARDTCRHLLDAATLSGSPVYEGLAYRLNAMRHYFQGRHFDALAAAEKALALLRNDNHPTLHWMRLKQLTGLILMHLKKYDRARRCLDQAEHYFQQTANPLALCETYLCQSLLADAHRQNEDAARLLNKGFSIASERRFEHFVMLRPADVEKCCRAAIKWLTPHQAGWPQNLLLSIPLSPINSAAPLTADARRPTSEEKKDKSSLNDETRQYLEIHTLGTFRVLRNGRIPITGQQWGGNRTKLLLKAILVHGIHDIPKDIIVEDLWPESAPRSAGQNFKVTLHRLRKILEPDLEKHEKSSFVHLNGGLVSLDKTHCRVDVQSFLTCCKDIKRAVLAKETNTILAMGRRVIDLYQGDFLPEDPYAPWVEMKRLALKDEYITTLLMMADIYEDQDRLEEAAGCCRSAIAADACLERANAKLMRLYAHQGRKNDAVSVYRKLKSALKEDLGVEPDQAITALYLRVRD